jgi:pimeloyl-ACP methyl ester carboxylesterase
MDKPIRDPEWKLYHIQGKVAKDATRIFFGGLYQGKAIFYFDAFRFFIESSKNVWEEISLPDNGFENDTSVISTAWKYSRNNVYYVSEVCSTEFFQGAHAFRVDGTKSIAAESYGNNSKIGRFADVNNIRIYYEIYGSGAPLLLLHGNSSSISSFEKQIPALAKQFRVIAVDSRGQGKSTEDGKTYTYDLFAEDMNAFLDHLHLDSVNIVGWSDGGNTGLIMAMNYPSRVRKLVTMGANIFINDHVVEKWVFKTLNKEKKDLLRDNYPGSANRLRLINLLLTEPKHHFDELNRVTCPVLVMAGEKDVIKESHTRNIAQAIPGSTLMIIPKATHYLPTEDAVTFNKAVIDFLK